MHLPVTLHPMPIYSLIGLFYLVLVSLIAYGNLASWPDDVPSLLFFLLTLTGGCLIVAGFNWNLVFPSPVLWIGMAVAFSLIAPMSLHYSLAFPTGRPIRRWVLPAIYSPWGAFLGAWIVLRLTRWPSGPDPALDSKDHVAAICWLLATGLGLMAAYFCAGLLAVIRGPLRADSPAVRAQAKWFVFGHFIFLLFAVPGVVSGLSDPKRFVLGGFDPYLVMAACFFSVPHIFALTRHRLPNVDLLIRSSLVHVLLAVFIAVMFASGLGLAGLQSGRQTPLRFDILLLVIVLTLVYLFEPMKRGLRGLVDRRLYARRYRLNEVLLGLGESLLKVMDGEALARVLVEHLSGVLGVDRFGVVLLSPEVEVFLSAQTGAVDRRVYQLPEPLVAALKEHRRPILSGEPVPSPAPGASTQGLDRHLASIGAHLVVPILAEEELLGVFHVGRPEGASFNIEEIQLLQSIASSAALALRNAVAHTRIQELNRVLEEKVSKVQEQKQEISRLQQKMLDENLTLKEELQRSGRFERIVGSSAQLREVLDQVFKIAPIESSVLILGETGTGKELLARAIHENSARRTKPFVKVNCAAIPETLLESELFGYERGAFTGASKRKIGRFELANGGTILLDEIGDVSLAVQAKLLRVLQEKDLEPLGGTRTIHVDVRVVATTNRDLARAVAEREFREDLYYRLNVIRIGMPPLRERKEDIFELALFFLRRTGPKVGKRMAGISDEARALLERYAWPGNVRELENAIERAVVLAEQEELTPDDFAFLVPRPREDVPAMLLDGRYDDMERRLLVEALERAKGNKSRAARDLGLKRTTFVNKLRRYGVQ